MSDQIKTTAPSDQPLRAWLQNIVDVYAARSEIFTSDEECARSLAARAQCALDGVRYQ